MSKTRKILTICLAIASISTMVLVVNTILNPETASIPVLVCSGIVPVVICIALFSSKQNGNDKA